MTKEPIKYKLPEDVANYIQQMAKMVYFQGEQESYYHLPEWYKMRRGSNIAEILRVEDMSEGLKKDLRIDQELSSLQAKYDKLEKAFNSLIHDYTDFVDGERGRDKESNKKFREMWLKKAGLDKQLKTTQQ